MSLQCVNFPPAHTSFFQQLDELPAIVSISDWFQWSVKYESLLGTHGFHEFLPGGAEENHPDTWETRPSKRKIRRWSVAQSQLCADLRLRLKQMLLCTREELANLKTVAQFWTAAEAIYKGLQMSRLVDLTSEMATTTLESFDGDFDRFVGKLHDIYSEMDYVGEECAFPDEAKLSYLLHRMEHALPGPVILEIWRGHISAVDKRDGQGNIVKPSVSWARTVELLRQAYRGAQASSVREASKEINTSQHGLGYHYRNAGIRRSDGAQKDRRNRKNTWRARQH